MRSYLESLSLIQNRTIYNCFGSLFQMIECIGVKRQGAEYTSFRELSSANMTFRWTMTLNSEPNLSP